MELQWPLFLFLLGLIPLFVGAYIWAQRRRTRYALRYSSLALVRQTAGRWSRYRRHLPFALFLVGLVPLILALTRPEAVVTVPSNDATIIVALDVSGSMRSIDIYPSRLEAAQEAAVRFIDQQKNYEQIGVVAFSGNAELVQPPTTDQEALRNAINRLTPGRATAIGSGILKSLDAITMVEAENSSGTPIPSYTPTPVAKGTYAPAIIVLLTDGVSNAGPLPMDAAQQAADQGVRIYTIAFGTANGRMPESGSPFGQGRGGGGFAGGFGGGFRTGVDETTLKNIAQLTGGEFYSASSAGQLESVFDKLPTYLIVKQEKIEVTALLTALGGLLYAAAIGLSMAWQGII